MSYLSSVIALQGVAPRKRELGSRTPNCGCQHLGVQAVDKHHGRKVVSYLRSVIAL